MPKLRVKRVCISAQNVGQNVVGFCGGFVTCF